MDQTSPALRISPRNGQRLLAVKRITNTLTNLVRNDPRGQETAGAASAVPSQSKPRKPKGAVFTLKVLLHALAGTAAIVIITAFIGATLYAEILGDAALVASVKSAIVFPGLFLLIPCLMTAGGLGFNLAKRMKAPLVQAKLKRMRVIAGLGVLVLIPCAVTLNLLAAEGAFDLRFQSLQLLELAAGSVNLTLLLMNLIDGVKLSARRKAATLKQGEARA